SPLTRHPPPPHPYPLSLHDALPISCPSPARPEPPSSRMRLRTPGSSATPPTAPPRDESRFRFWWRMECTAAQPRLTPFSTKTERDRKSTRLNSSHVSISYAVFCLKK